MPADPTLPEPRPDDEGRETTGPLTMSEVNDYASAYYDYVRGKVEGLPEAFARREAYWAAYQKLSDRLAPLAPHPAPRGATDEGLREAARAFLAVLPWDIGWSPMVKHAHTDLRTALRAALQAGG